MWKYLLDFIVFPELIMKLNRETLKLVVEEFHMYLGKSMDNFEYFITFNFQ